MPARPSPPGAIVTGARVSSASASPGPDEQIALHLRQPQLAIAGRRLTLASLVVEDVAPDPGSGGSDYGVVIAQLELSAGSKTETVELVSPVLLHPEKPVAFGVQRASFVSSASEHEKDPVVVVRVERIGSPP